jgi:aminopeptidase N
MITCKDWHHIWLNEGFATYSEGVYLEAKNGQNAYNQFINSEMNSAKNANGTIWVQNINSVGEIFNGSRSYAKGAVVLHMLRGVVGDSSTFFDIMRTYSSDPDLKYGVATTEDFQAIAESVYGQSLDYFFQEWIYGEKYPRYTAGWSKTHLSGNEYRVNLTISQVVNSNPSFFTMPVQIKINTSLGDTITTVFNNQQNQDFEIIVSGEPTSLVFDPNNFILKTVTIVANVDDFIHPYEYALEQNYPNPFNPSTKIKYQIADAGFVNLQVYDVLGNEVATLISKEMQAGSYEVEFDASNLPSGIYYYTLSAGSYMQTKKMVLLR